MNFLSFNQYHQGILPKDCNHSDVFLSNLCDLRTQEWLPKLEKYVRLKDTFIAVGLAHVSGILEWAQGKGYTIKRSKLRD